MEHGDDVVGDDAGPGVSASSSRLALDARKPTASRQVPRAARAAAAESGDMCYLCEKTDGDTLLKIWRGVRLHAICWNAIRAFQRKLETKRQKDEELIKFSSKVREWRADILPFIVQPGVTRLPQVRNAGSDGGEETVAFEQKVREERVLLLPKGRYKQYMKFWEGWTEDEASSEFEREIERQSDNEEDSAGNARLRVCDNVCIVHRTGRIKKGHEPMSLVDSQGGPTLSEATRLSRGRSMVSESNYQPSPTGTVPGEGEESDDEMDVKRSRREVSVGRSGGKATPRSEKSSRRRPADASLATKLGRSLTLVEFMHEKKRLQSESSDALKLFESKNFVKGRIDTMWTKLTEDQQKPHFSAYEETMQYLCAGIGKMRKLRGEIEAMQIGDIDDCRERLAACMTEADKIAAKAEHFFEGAKFLVEECTQAQRKSQLHERYLRTKLGTKLMLGGFGKSFSKFFANRFYDTTPQEGLVRNVAGEEFDITKVTVWDSTNEVGRGINQKVMAMAANFKAAADDKVQSLQKTMDNPKNEKWTGSMAKVGYGDGLSLDDLELRGISGKCAGPGREPWMICMRGYSWRWGPNLWPLPGVGAFVAPVGAGTVLQIIKVESLTQEGMVALGDTPGFLETPSGNKVISCPGSYILVDLRASSSAVAWVPYGYVASPLYIPAVLPEEGPLPDPTDLAFLWSLAIIDAGMSSSVPAPAMGAIAAFNRMHFDRMGSSTLWTSRAAAFESIV